MNILNSNVNKMEDTFLNQLDPPLRERRPLQRPFRLIYELTCFLTMIIPLTIQSIIVNLFFTNPKSVKDKVILVTGSGRGLGRRLVEKFVQLGARVACVDIDDSINRETVRQINEKYPDCAKSYTCDVAKMEDVKKLKDAVKKDFGPVDILINSAGLVVGSQMCNQDEDLIKTVIEVNLTSHFYMIRQFLPDMIERNEGHIVAISSVTALSPSDSYSLYAATKSGVLSLMSSLYRELRENPHNSIQTTTICPWLIDTSGYYENLWNTRIPFLSIEEAVDGCIDGIRRNKRIFTVPSSYYFIFLLLQLLPDSVNVWFHEIFYAKIADLSKEAQNKIPVSRLLSSRNQ